MQPGQTPLVLSVDLEEHFHAEVFASAVNRSEWDSLPSRVEKNTFRLLDLFDECGAKATFFTVGWTAERHPALIREIVRRGHEAACHSYWHRLIFKLTPEEFREDTQRAKDVIEQASGTAVIGYRAPSFSITKESLWALPLLAQSGLTYDCSVYPIRHDVYGIPDAPRHPFRIKAPAGELVEFPMPTFLLAGRLNMPGGGGAYLRLLPFSYTRLAVREFQKAGLPVIVYVHPWEIDPEQPRINLPIVKRLRHYTNLGRTYGKLRRLLKSGRWLSFRDSGLLNSEIPYQPAFGTVPAVS